MSRAAKLGAWVGLFVTGCVYAAVAPFDCTKVEAYTTCSGWLAHEYSVAGAARPAHWQAVATGLIIGVPVGSIVWAVSSGAGSGAARYVLRGALLVVTLLSLAAIFSVGAFTSPVLLVPLWYAARSGEKLERWGWIVLAAPCAWIAGWLVAASTGSWEDTAHGIAAVILVFFVATTGTRAISRGSV